MWADGICGPSGMKAWFQEKRAYLYVISGLIMAYKYTFTVLQTMENLMESLVAYRSSRSNFDYPSI